MATRYVVDTNVLVHSLDSREPKKRERAREVLRRVGGAGTAALPVQVLSEFWAACLRKLESRLDAEAIRREVERLMLVQVGPALRSCRKLRNAGHVDTRLGKH
jgi:predicted nucleic acid-binding protein